MARAGCSELMSPSHLVAEVGNTGSNHTAEADTNACNRFMQVTLSVIAFGKFYVGSGYFMCRKLLSLVTGLFPRWLLMLLGVIA